MTVRPGPHDPSSSTPPRRPRSVRRTTSVDMVRPRGLTGPLVLVGAGRDLATDDEGRQRELGQAAARVEVDFMASLTVRSIASTPVEPALQALVGEPVLAGFRWRCEAALDGGGADRALLRAVLDDAPVTTVVSGHVLAAAGIVGYRKGRPRRADVCAGWIADGAPIQEAHRTGLPVAVSGPAAPSLARPDDGDGWHHLDHLPPHSMRRVRRIDVEWGAPVLVDAVFRDTYADADGTVTVIHEYGLQAVIDPERLVVARIAATPHVLPFAECPAAAASAQALVGRPVTEVRELVRASFDGPATCTHLNDLLRAVPEVVAIARARHAP